MTNTKMMNANVQTANLADYARDILNIRKNTIKFSISDIEVLSDVLGQLFGERIDNKTEMVNLLFNDSKFASSAIQVKAYGKIYKIYSHVPESKIRQQLGK